MLDHVVKLKRGCTVYTINNSIGKYKINNMANNIKNSDVLNIERTSCDIMLVVDNVLFIDGKHYYGDTTKKIFYIGGDFDIVMQYHAEDRLNVFLAGDQWLTGVSQESDFLSFSSTSIDCSTKYQWVIGDDAEPIHTTIDEITTNISKEGVQNIVTTDLTRIDMETFVENSYPFAGSSTRNIILKHKTNGKYFLGIIDGVEVYTLRPTPYALMDITRFIENLLVDAESFNIFENATPIVLSFMEIDSVGYIEEPIVNIYEYVKTLGSKSLNETFNNIIENKGKSIYTIKQIQDNTKLCSFIKTASNVEHAMDSIVNGIFVKTFLRKRFGLDSFHFYYLYDSMISLALLTHPFPDSAFKQCISHTHIEKLFKDIPTC